MTKTIEEAAKRFADMKTTKQAGSSVERDKKALLMTQFFHFALEELPLSERLTAEEKERVKRIYKELKSLYTENKDSIFRFAEVYKGQYELLESIFGKDFFKEGE